MTDWHDRRIAELEAEVARLRAEVCRLRGAYDDLATSKMALSTRLGR